MSSENPIGAGNQQETKELEEPLDPWWIVGFVDGEGMLLSKRPSQSNERPAQWRLAAHADTSICTSMRRRENS